MDRNKQFTLLFTLILLAGVIFVACDKEKDKIGLPERRSVTKTLDPLMGSQAYCNKNATAKSAKSTATRSASNARSVIIKNTIYNTDFVSAGVGGMRDVGNGIISLSGVSGTVTQAFLYWSGVTNSTTDVGNSIVVNSATVNGTNIGYSDNNCWGYLNSQAYRADVTSLVQSTKNGNYNLSGFGEMNPNGASLVVFFNDGNNSNNRDVVIFDGNDSNIDFPGIPGNPNAPADPYGWDVTLSGINYTSGAATIQLHVADGQQFPDDALVLNSTEIAPPGPVFNGNTLPGGTGPNGGGNLWDIRSFSVTSFLKPGSNTLHLTTGVNSDCLGLIVALIDLPRGAAPPPVNKPLEVNVDIKPQTCPNLLDVAETGYLVASIVGTTTYDISTIDLSTLKLNGVTPIRVNTDDLATPFPAPRWDCSSCTTAGKDGIRDIRMVFNAQQFISSLGSVTNGQCIVVRISGNLLPAYGGTAIKGVDRVKIVKTM